MISEIILPHTANIIQILLISTLMILSLYFTTLSTNNSQFIFQGFGTDADFRYISKIIVKNQAELSNAIKTNFTMIVFADEMSINLTKALVLQNVNNIIIVGPIELKMQGIVVLNSKNIILWNIRILNSSLDGILVSNSNNIVMNGLTILDSGRESVDRGKCIDLTENSTNLTVSNSILGYTVPFMSLIKNKGMLIANFLAPSVMNFSIHHNIFYCNYERSPQISTQGLFQMENNIIFNWTEYGTRVRNNAYGNIINNLYIGARKDPLVIVQQQENTEAILFIKNNILKKSKDQTQHIEDDIRHEKYDVPIITPSSFSDTLNNAGCKKKQQTYEDMIRSNLNKYF